MALGDAHELIAHRVATSLTVGTAMLAFALVLVFALIVRRGKGRKGRPSRSGY